MTNPDLQNQRRSASGADKHETDGLEPLQHVLLQDRVYDALKKALMSGQFAPGERLTVRSLAERFATSPMPVREALLRLASLNALEGQPNRTLRVPEFSADTLSAVCRVRVELEGAAAEWAASRISAEAIAELKSIYAKEREAALSGNAKALHEANRDFHFTIYRAAECPPLIPCLEMLWFQVGPYFGSAALDDFLLGLLDLHRDAITALENREGLAAREAIVANIRNSAEYMVHQWNQR